MLAIIGVLLLYLFNEPMFHLYKVWDTREEYSHGFLIPVLSIFFIYQAKNSLLVKQFDGSWVGFMIALLGFIFAIIGNMTTIYVVVQYAFILSIFGIAYAYLGKAAFRDVYVAFLLLLFMIPLPEFLYQNISQQLQLLSSYLGVLVIRLFDISVYLEGNVIDLGNYQLQVVDACSGLRYLFPLMCFGFICAHIFKAPLWQKLIVFFTTIPITVLMNSFRIGVIGVLVNYWGIEQAEGFLHDFEGWIIFMACVGVLFIEMWLFAVFFQKRSSLSEVFAVELPGPIPKNASKKINDITLPVKLLLSLLIILTAASFQLNDRQEIIPDRKEFVTYPDNIGVWEGKRNKLEQIYIDILAGLTDYIISDYFHPSGDSVNLYAAYYSTQSSGGSIHSPKQCIPGGGWSINNLTQIEVEADQTGNEKITVNRTVIQLGKSKQLVYYWFAQRGRNLADEYLLKWYMFYDSLMINRTDGALLRLTTRLKPNEDEADADKRLQAFLKNSYPLFDGYLPE